MTYRQLQSALKDLRDSGVDIGCKLNANKDVLQSCYLALVSQGLVKNLKGVDLSRTNLNCLDLSNAVLSGANLKVSHLSNANLSHADLSNADLTYSDLSDADLSNADLNNSDLSNADLSHADLSNVDLSNTDLSGACLRDANLSGSIGYKPVTANAIDLILQIADIVVSNIDKLEMGEVHTCDSVHCAGGWACVLDPEAMELEIELGWNVAACTVCPIPEFTGLFYSTNEEMLDFLTKTLKDKGQSLREKYLLA